MSLSGNTVAEIADVMEDLHTNIEISARAPKTYPTYVGCAVCWLVFVLLVVFGHLGSTSCCLFDVFWSSW